MDLRILSHLSVLLNSIEKGKELDNVEAWKKTGVLTSLVTSAFGLCFIIANSFGYLTNIDESVIMMTSSVAVSLVGLFLSWIQTATTKKIGLKSSEE